MSDRTEYTRGMRALADLLDTNPELSLPYEGVKGLPAQIYIGGAEPLAQAITYVQAMDGRPVGRFVLLHSNPTFWLEITGILGGFHVEVNLRTAEVCEQGTGGWVIPAELLELIDVTAEDRATSTSKSADPAAEHPRRSQEDHLMSMPPNGCRWCGTDKQDHVQRWTEATDDDGRRVGWHQWTAPPQELIKQRMLARRAT